MGAKLGGLSAEQPTSTAMKENLQLHAQFVTT